LSCIFSKILSFFKPARVKVKADVARATVSKVKANFTSKSSKVHKHFVQSFRDSLGFFYLLKRHAKRRKKSHVLSVEEIIHIAGHKSMYLLILIFNLPTIFPIPLPPGVSVLGTIPCILVAGHLLFGKKNLMLPKRLLSVSIKKNLLLKITDTFHLSLFKFSKIFKKRMSFFFTPTALKFIGLHIIIMSIILLLPIPFTNLAVGMSIVLVSLGLLLEDGLFVFFGLVWGMFAIMFCIFLVLLGKALVLKALAYFGLHLGG